MEKSDSALPELLQERLSDGEEPIPNVAEQVETKMLAARNTKVQHQNAQVHQV